MSHVRPTLCLCSVVLNTPFYTETPFLAALLMISILEILYSVWFYIDSKVQDALKYLVASVDFLWVWWYCLISELWLLKARMPRICTYLHTKACKLLWWNLGSRPAYCMQSRVIFICNCYYCDFCLSVFSINKTLVNQMLKNSSTLFYPTTKAYEWSYVCTYVCVCSILLTYNSGHFVFFIIWTVIQTWS